MPTVTPQKKLTSTPATLRNYLNMLRTMRKPKCQRPAYWFIQENPTKLNHPSIEKFIEYIFEHYHIGHEGFCIQKEFKNNGFIYSVYDGNNRINAILYFLDYPYKVFPKKYSKINKLIDKVNEMSQEDKENFKNIIHSYDYETLYNNCTDLEQLFGVKYHKDEDGEDDDELHISEQPLAWQLYNILPGPKQRQLKNRLNDWKKSFGERTVNGNNIVNNFLDITILASFYENYTPEDLAKVFICNRYRGTKMSQNDLYAAKLCYIYVHVTNTPLKHNLLSIIKNYYDNRNNDYEQVTQYAVRETETRLNAFDFIVAFTDYCSNKYGLFKTFLESKDNESSFFVLYQALYKRKQDICKDLNVADFCSNNVNDFISNICNACEILQECVDSLYLPSCNEKLFNSSANKRLVFTNKLPLQALLFSIIMQIKTYEEPDIDMMKSKIKVILYYGELYKKIGGKKGKKEAELKNKIFKPHHPLDNLTCGHWTEWIYNIKVNPDILFDKVSGSGAVEDISCNLTPNIMQKLISHLLNKQSNVRPYIKKKKRRKLTMLDKFIMGDYYFNKMPTAKRKQVFSNEHIVPLSTIYENCEIDIDRLGNLLPTWANINSGRKNRDLTCYYEDDTFMEFTRYLQPILYTNDEYHTMIEYERHGSNSCPVMKNIEKYNEICDRNEKIYMNNFINNMFEGINNL